MQGDSDIYRSVPFIQVLNLLTICYVLCIIPGASNAILIERRRILVFKVLIIWKKLNSFIFMWLYIVYFYVLILILILKITRGTYLKL